MPRGSAALGFAQYLPSENLLMTTQQMADMTCMALGGRAAEQVLLGKISTGAPHAYLCIGRLGGRCSVLTMPLLHPLCTCRSEGA